MSAPTYVNDTDRAKSLCRTSARVCNHALSNWANTKRTVAQCNKPIVRPSKAGRRALIGASRVEVQLRNGATSTSRARCRSKKSPSALLRRFDISREQDGEVLGFIPVYVNRFVEHTRTAISKA
jgi:hypothetical protein